MKRYKRKYSSNLQLVKAFATRSLDPAGDQFESRNGRATHRHLIHNEIGTLAVWHGDQMFRTSWGRTNSGMNMHRRVNWEHRKRYENVPGVSTAPRVIDIPYLSHDDTFEDMRNHILDAARRFFRAAKRARQNAPTHYDTATRYFNKAADFSMRFNLPLPTAADLPEDFESWWVVYSFKTKADHGRSAVKVHTLHPCYTATLQPDHAVAA